MPAATIPPLNWWRPAVVLAAGLCAYSNALSAPFLFDDVDSVLNNTHIRRLADFASVWHPPRETPVAGRPLVNLSFAINYAIGGVSAHGYHVANIGIHLCCALLVLGLLLETLTLPRLRAPFGAAAANLACAVALLWAVHPLNSEAVDYVSQRTTSLMALFYLAAMYASVRAWRSRSRVWAAIAVGSCLAGMACQESMVTAPVAIVLFDAVLVFGSFREALRTRWRLYLGLAATWIPLALLLSGRPRPYSAGFGASSAWEYLLNQTMMITHYLKVSVWPRSLVLAYGPPAPVTLTAVAPYACLVLLLLAATVALIARRSPAGFLGAWFFLTLAPSSSIVPVATEVGAERRMYLPLIAVIAAAVLGVHWAWSRFGRTLASRAGGARRATAAGVVAVVLVAAPLAISTRARNAEYASPLQMARTILARWPTGVAHSLVGEGLAAAGQHHEAIEQLRLATPTYPRAHYFLGRELFAENKFDESVAELRTFIRAQPMLVYVVPAHLMIASAYEAKGRWSDALAECQTVLSMVPGETDAQLLFADALSGTKRYAEAIPHYVSYLAAKPDDAAALSNYGIALVMADRSADAIPAFRRAVTLKPKDAQAHANLARALLDRREASEAELESRTALRLAPDNAAASAALGASLALQGRREEALVAFKAALVRDPDDPLARQGMVALTR